MLVTTGVVVGFLSSSTSEFFFRRLDSAPRLVIGDFLCGWLATVLSMACGCNCFVLALKWMVGLMLLLAVRFRGRVINSAR